MSFAGVAPLAIAPFTLGIDEAHRLFNGVGDITKSLSPKIPAPPPVPTPPPAANPVTLADASKAISAQSADANQGSTANAGGTASGKKRVPFIESGTGTVGGLGVQGSSNTTPLTTQTTLLGVSK